MRHALALVLALAACTRDASEPQPQVKAAAPADTTATVAREWRSNPASGVRISGGNPLVVETGPHALLLPATVGSLSPPYTIHATMHKRRGRLHEGYGLAFGGENLQGREDLQAYSYFMVRGDGSFLIKQRKGATTSVIRDWTNHPAVPRDTEEGGQPVELAVHAGTDRVRFNVAGQEIASIPASELLTRGGAGVRVAHGVQLSVSNFRVTQGN